VSNCSLRLLREIDATLVARLVGSQFPHWSGLPITAAEPNGWDNRTFRLGPELLVRLPSADRYAAQVRKEHRWLPVLAPHLPLPKPGCPQGGLPYRTTSSAPARWKPTTPKITFAGNLQADQAAAATARRVIDEVLD
jgi:hypothetical protein